MAACTVALSERAHEEAASAAIVDMANQALELGHDAIGETARIMSEDQYSLLSHGGLFGDLFYLPMRLSRILGWIGGQHFIGEWVGNPEALEE